MTKHGRPAHAKIEITNPGVVVSVPEALLHARERRITVEEYHAMREAGIFSEDDRIELLDGHLVTVIVFRRPEDEGYAERIRHSRGDDVTLMTLPDLEPLPVADVLGPQ